MLWVNAHTRPDNMRITVKYLPDVQALTIAAIHALFMLPAIFGGQTDETAAIVEGIGYGGGIGSAFLLAYLIWNERRIRILLRQHDSGRTRPY